MQAGTVVKLVKAEDFSYPVPEIVATFPGDKTVPACNKMTFEN